MCSRRLAESPRSRRRRSSRATTSAYGVKRRVRSSLKYMPCTVSFNHPRASDWERVLPLPVEGSNDKGGMAKGVFVPIRVYDLETIVLTHGLNQLRVIKSDMLRVAPKAKQLHPDRLRVRQLRSPTSRTTRDGGAAARYIAAPGQRGDAQESGSKKYRHRSGWSVRETP